jgi:2,4-dienoyl-CoA reductase-like NADH-dependent reductase (Old Yellow Enzyme family)
MLWGLEAMAVRVEGKANPKQIVMDRKNLDAIRAGMDGLVEEHIAAAGSADDMVMGLQLTHSGRFSRPHVFEKLEPSLAYRHPVLDRKQKLSADHPILSDDEVKSLIEAYIDAARMAETLGADFVDVKQCHGYLGHEFLSAFSRPGPYGGPELENRSRFAREIIQGIRQAVPKMAIGVRLSIFDFPPFCPGPDGTGVPEEFTPPYQSAFGVDASNALKPDLTEPIAYVGLMKSWGVTALNLSAGSPYYNPHIQRPAFFPPSDGYQPPEDPLVGVARQIAAVRAVKAAHPDMITVGSGFTYLQEYIPHVGQALVREGYVDVIGLGRMVLSYPELPLDVLNSGKLETKRICRTFSDCTTAPRSGIKSGCFPLDEYYRKSPEGEKVRELKKALKAG